MESIYVYVVIMPIDEDSDTAECVFETFEDAKKYVKDSGFIYDFTNGNGDSYYKSNHDYRVIIKVKLYKSKN